MMMAKEPLLDTGVPVAVASKFRAVPGEAELVCKSGA